MCVCACVCVLENAAVLFVKNEQEGFFDFTHLFQEYVPRDPVWVVCVVCVCVCARGMYVCMCMCVCVCVYVCEYSICLI